LGADGVLKTLFLGRQEKCALMKGAVAVDSEAILIFINDRLLIADYSKAP
jgi:hypothetical protein